MARTPRARKGKKPKGNKRVSYTLINRDDVVGQPIYALMGELIEAHHPDLRDADRDRRIALAFCTSWKPDRDGRCILGKCVKASDLHRELAPYDFVILIKREWWYDEHVKKEDRFALLDHELCHAGVTYDERTGEPVYDERGRKVYRIIKHDLEEFSAIAQRYGCWKADIEKFYAALNRSYREQFKPCDTCKDGPAGPGWIEVEDGGAKRNKRCQCWLTWAQRYNDAQPDPSAQKVAS